MPARSVVNFNPFYVTALFSYLLKIAKNHRVLFLFFGGCRRRPVTVKWTSKMDWQKFLDMFISWNFGKKNRWRYNFKRFSGNLRLALKSPGTYSMMLHTFLSVLCYFFVTSFSAKVIINVNAKYLDNRLTPALKVEARWWVRKFRLVLGNICATVSWTKRKSQLLLHKKNHIFEKIRE